MLMNSPDNDSDLDATSSWRIKDALTMAAAMALIAAVLGSILQLAFCAANSCAEPAFAGTIGCLFGGLLGGMVGLVFGSSRRLRNLRKGSGLRMMLTFAFLGAVSGLFLLLISPFSESWAMAVFLAFEGAIAGGFIGGLLGIIVRVIFKPKS